MAVSVSKYNKTNLHLGKGEINFAADTFKVMLLSAAYSYSGAHDVVADVSASQIAAGNGYVVNGPTIANRTFASAGAVATFDGDDIVLTAAGGAIGPFRYAVIYDSTTGYLVAFVDMGQIVTVANGDQFTFRFNNTGILQLI